MSGDIVSEDAVLLERRGRVMIITLNRPDQMNAINGALSNGLWSAVQELNADSGLTAGVLTGNGRGFCSGGDVKAMNAANKIKSASPLEEKIAPVRVLVLTLISKLTAPLKLAFLSRV